MPDREKQIYNSGADQYERLIACEDYQGSLLPAIDAITHLDHLHAVDLGTGTGRLVRLLASHLTGIVGLDLSAGMLQVAQRELRRGNQTNWLLGLADHRSLPLASASVDLVISGWSVCYLAVWHPRTWRNELERALQEMQRVLRPHGAILLLETLGTGRITPQPSPGMEAYLDWLAEKGFVHTWLRTDYHFKDRPEAEQLSRFFFGDEMPVQLIDDPTGVVLPECTGLWWLSKPH